MAIGRTWEESIQKALRMVDPNVKGFQPRGDALSKDAIISEFHHPTDKRIFAIAQVLESGEISPSDITKHSNIDPWFIARLHRISNFRSRISGSKLSAINAVTMKEAKQLGFSDVQLANILVNDVDGKFVNDDEVRAHRIQQGVTPFVKQIDTLSAEYPAQTNYLYMTYHGNEDDIEGNTKSRIVLGSGSYRIGSSVEFDWCGVSTIRALRQMVRFVLEYNNYRHFE